MDSGDEIREGVSGGNKKPPVKKYSDRVYKVLLHLRDAIDGDRVTGITDMVFQYLEREWTVEPATRIDDTRFFCLTRYNGQPRLQSDTAGWMLTIWELRAVENHNEFAFGELVKFLMSKPRTTMSYRMYQPGDWKRVIAVRNTLTPEEKRALNLMTPSEQTQFYRKHPAFRGMISE